MDTNPDDLVLLIRQWIDDARSVAVLTGAGISTDSGISDFRGPQGLWTKNPEAEKMATLQHYVADPEIRKRAWRSRLEDVSGNFRDLGGKAMDWIGAHKSTIRPHSPTEGTP